MKRFLLLGVIAIALSGCVSETSGRRGYDPYWDGYEARPVVIDRGRYRPRPVYRDDRPTYREPYRGPYRGPSRDDFRAARRDDDRRSDGRRFNERRSDVRDDGPGRRGPSTSIGRERIPEQSARAGSDLRPARAPGLRPSGPRPYTPPVRAQ